MTKSFHPHQITWHRQVILSVKLHLCLHFARSGISLLTMSKLGFEDYQVLADSACQLLYDRVTAAEPIETLSAHDNKLLQVVETADGERLVTRSYTPEAVEEIEYNYGLDIKSAWEKMHETFTQAGIAIVPSKLIEVKGGEYPFIVVSEYLEDAKPLVDASTTIKRDTAVGLSKLLIADGDFVPAPEMIRGDMFAVVERGGREEALLLDVDPLITPAYRMQKIDQNSRFYINRLAELAWDWWCTDEEERKEVISAMVMTLADFVTGRFDVESGTSRAFMDLHLMSNGVDMRQLT